jgi:hypothetical protein
MSRREAVKQWIFGTVDRVIIRGTHVDIVDFKFGVGEIDDADMNIQGQAYLLGVMDKFPELKTATVHFIIPRRDEVLKHDYTKEDMEDIRLRINLIVERAEAEDRKAIPNTEGCKYCKHKLECPALSDKLLPLAKKYSASVDDFEMTLWGSYAPEKVEDPAVLSKMLNVASVVNKWQEAAKKQALKLAVEEGEEIPGYDLHYRTASLKIEDAQEAFEAVQHIMTPEDFMAACDISLPKLAKKYAEKLERGQKKNARGVIELSLEEAGVLPAEEDRDRSPYLRKSQNL